MHTTFLRRPMGHDSRRRALHRWLCALLAMLALTLAAALPQRAAAAAYDNGPGGPILVITSATPGSFGRYYNEILRNEGLNAFATADLSSVSASTLAAYDLVILDQTALTPAQVSMLGTWVQAGGNLIAMAPDAQLAPLLGLTPLPTTLSNAYLLIDTTQAPGAGLVDQTIQYHGLASLYSLSGASAVATLYTSATAATTSPAVSLRSVGSGRAAAFTYDLARSIVYTRQGNPAWSAQERDGYAPIRSDDKFYGKAASDLQSDWIDLSKAAIPQADEQQRLLANLILRMTVDQRPLPRFWYFPFGKRAVVLMSGDDHGNAGTIGRFEQFLAASPAGCSVADWQCIRGTSYVYPATPITAAQASTFAGQGFEVGLHVSTGCEDYSAASLEASYVQQIASWQAQFPALPSPVTQRHHCIVWSDWTSGAQVQLAHGMRLDTSYYFWPPSWAADVPGLFNGTAMPMRFASLSGEVIDVYQATTQMTDESGQSYPMTVDTLLDRALGPQGYFGVYTVNAHTDLAASLEADAVVASAKARGVPVVSAQQLLAWLDGRNASTFDNLQWNGSVLSFSITAGPSTRGLRAMLPAARGGAVLQTLTRGGAPVPLTFEGIKGVLYASFDAVGGSHVATYGADGMAPTVATTLPSAGASEVPVDTVIRAVFSEPLDPASVSTSTVRLTTTAGAAVPAAVTYDAATRTVQLTATLPLAGQTSYTVTLAGAPASPRLADIAGNALAPYAWTFTTAQAPAGPVCPCGGWAGSSAVPAAPSVDDPNAVELGVKFRTDIAGYVTGVRFYKGAGNTGTHVGSLWTASGARLATAIFTNETATGWQEVQFSAPVAISANTVYVASYFAPNGRYAGDNQFFAAAGVDNGPVHLLRDGVSGGNGVYLYGSAGGFPSQTWAATNYWVDIAFTTAPPADTAPPTVQAIVPAAGATGVNPGTSVTARMSEPIDPATISASTVALRDAGGNAIAASIGYDATSSTITLTPTSALVPGATVTLTLQGGASDPRIKDVAGNALAASVSSSFVVAPLSPQCAAPANAVVAENCRAGNPASEWDIRGAGDPSIQGYATDLSIARGSSAVFKIKTDASAYRLDIYRLGWYAGLGARKVASVTPTASLPQTQPACLNDAATGLVDCGNWAVSASWSVPADAVSGVYIARAVRLDTGGASHIVFVVRNDASTSDLLFQTSDTTWQAYNDYGGNSLYAGSPVGRAYKVSYNRPFNTRAVDAGQDWVFNSEYPMIRWLERNGYDVSYATGIDTDRYGALLRNHRVFLSVGHDEYWSAGQRANVEAARNAGVHLAFFSGNEVFWKTRWEPSVDGSATAHRTLVCYKETHAGAKIDPNAAWTGTWRDPRFSPPADGGLPENALTGTLFMVNDGATTAIEVPAAEGRMRLWRNTSIASLPAGTTATLAPQTLGYEWDADVDNGSRPSGLLRMSLTSVTSANAILQDWGSSYGAGTVEHALTLYRHPSGALVFGAGTVQWPWGLDATHDRSNAPADVRMQQATVNLLADMSAQPATLQSDLVAATASSDTVAPTATIATPAAGATVPPNVALTITGSATDAGGGIVGAVEVSVDGGATWRRASGRANWTYAWTPTSLGSATIRVRAVDDSANLQAVPTVRSVTVATAPTDTTAPRVQSIWPASGASFVVRTAAPYAVFNEAIDPATINAGTMRMTSPSGAVVAASVSYNPSTRRATLVPNAGLSAFTRYTVTVQGGPSGVKDLAGNALAVDRIWRFTTR